MTTPRRIEPDARCCAGRLDLQYEYGIMFVVSLCPLPFHLPCFYVASKVKLVVLVAPPSFGMKYEVQVSIVLQYILRYS
jgi:hypothetical protein